MVSRKDNNNGNNSINKKLKFTNEDKISISTLIKNSSIYATKEALENFTLLDGESSDHVLKLNQLIKKDNELNGYYSAFNLTLACKFPCIYIYTITHFCVSMIY